VAEPGPIGLIAGDGTLPGEIARAARAKGRDLVAVAFPQITEPQIDEDALRVEWLNPGQLGAALRFLRDAGVREAVMAGKVSKAGLLAGGVELDDRARALIAGLVDLGDATLLSAIAKAIEEEGISLRPQAELVPDLIAGPGALGRVRPTPEQWLDVRFAWPIARTVASLDIGQTVVVHDRAVVAVEALEGTDEAIRRAGRLGRPGLCIVKVARPEQDLRFDLPAVGPGTLEVAAEAGAVIVAIEAGQTLVLDREAVVEQANRAGIALVGVPAAGPNDELIGESD
jgi:DUF1009 family protein